jgi:hypothetical protein
MDNRKNGGEGDADKETALPFFFVSSIVHRYLSPTRHKTSVSTSPTLHLTSLIHCHAIFATLKMLVEFALRKGFLSLKALNQRINSPQV